MSAGTPPLSLSHAYGRCHALTAALLSIAPMGEPLGLFVGENCVHSIFRVPHTSTYVDAFGAEGDADALKTKASRYLRRDDVYEWRTLSERQVWLMISGTRSRERRAARPLALELVKNL